MAMVPDSYPGSRVELRSHSTSCEGRLPFFFPGLEAHVQYRVVVVPSASIFCSQTQRKTPKSAPKGNRERLARGPGGGNEHPWSPHGCGESSATMALRTIESSNALNSLGAPPLVGWVRATSCRHEAWPSKSPKASWLWQSRRFSCVPCFRDKHPQRSR